MSKTKLGSSIQPIGCEPILGKFKLTKTELLEFEKESVSESSTKQAISFRLACAMFVVAFVISDTYRSRSS